MLAVKNYIALRPVSATTFTEFCQLIGFVHFVKLRERKKLQKQAPPKLRCVNNFPLRILCLPRNHFSSILPTHIGFVHLVKLHKKTAEYIIPLRDLLETTWSSRLVQIPKFNQKKAPLIVKCRIRTDLLKSSLKMTFKPCV